ncbi:hypothetical protein T09_1698 [Trichinella sp. T9]|nr:hypothetical protein T09_1698 [Trichinella sp. T9]
MHRYRVVRREKVQSKPLGQLVIRWIFTAMGPVLEPICVCFLSNNQMGVSYCDGAINGELDRIVGPEWVRLPDVLTRSSNVETRRRGGQCDGATLRWKVKLKDH